jgi:outer membrane murein-binding lipoprotein Lpp
MPGQEEDPMKKTISMAAAVLVALALAGCASTHFLG